jgi:hypothetical protein
MNENDLFNYLKNKISDLEKTNEFDSTDVYSLFYDFRAELKCRDIHYDDLIIEKIKYDNLINCKENNVRYINWTPNGIYSFDIRKIIEPKWFFKLLPKTTQFENKEHIKKLVGYLNIQLAKKI